MKNILITESQLKKILESTNNEKHWYDTSDIKTQEKTFVWDTKEYLTGHFGTIGVEKEKKVMTILLKIFREAQLDIHQHGPNPNHNYVETICRLFGYNKVREYPESDLDYPEDVYNDIVGIIEVMYNGE
jgi:hypothetical protein